MVMTYWATERTGIDLGQLVEERSAEVETPTASDHGPLSSALWDFPWHNGFPRADFGQTWHTYKDRNPHPRSPFHSRALSGAAEAVEHLSAYRKIDDWFLGEAMKAVAAEPHEGR